MGNLLVAINKENFIGANCVYYGKADLLYAISLVKDILDNYNANLVSSKLENTPLAVRMLQRENAEGTLNLCKKAWVQSDSLKYLEESFSMFNVADENSGAFDNLACIGVSNYDKSFNRKEGKMSIEIDLTRNCVKFLNCYMAMTKHYWMKDHTDEEFRSLKVSDYDFSCISFNDLEELFYFVQKNHLGWLSNDKIYVSQVLVPIELS